MALDIISFLANIVLVAYADGKLSKAELGLLESIRGDLKIKKGDLTAAIKSVEHGQYKMVPVGSFPDQVKNLELILRVAYVDDDLSEAEDLFVKEFAQAAGVSAEQLGRMRSEIMAALNEQGKLCGSCGADADVDARFCPKCGNNLSMADDIAHIAMKIPEKGLAIEFAESTAAVFPKALEIAKVSSGFQSCQKNKKIWYLATYPSDALADATPLCVALSGIRNRRLYIDGKETPWDEVFGFVWCAERRSTAYRPVEYCFGKDENRINPWGCRQANMDWSEWSRWFCYGQWEKGGIFGGKILWRFDKDRIRHELATNLFRYRFCPHLHTDLSSAVLKHLPETINPESDHAWGYRRAYEQVPGSIKVVEKETSGSITFKNEYWSDGVSPNGNMAFNDIFTKALNDLGPKFMPISKLLK